MSTSFDLSISLLGIHLQNTSNWLQRFLYKSVYYSIVINREKKYLMFIIEAWLNKLEDTDDTIYRKGQNNGVDYYVLIGMITTIYYFKKCKSQKLVSLANQTTMHVTFRRGIIDTKLLPVDTFVKDSGNGDFSHFIVNGKCSRGKKAGSARRRFI